MKTRIAEQSKTTARRGAVKQSAGGSSAKVSRSSAKVIAKSFRWLGFGGVIGVVAIALVALVPQLQSWSAVPISEVEFSGYSGGEFAESGYHGVTEEELLEIALPFMGESYWQVSVDQLKRAVEQHPWVRQATVRKQWPEKLWVGVDEYVPVARWNDRQLLSVNGELFRVEQQQSFDTLPKFLIPWVISPDSELVRTLVEQYNGFQRALSDVELQIEEMHFLTTENILLKTSGGLKIYLGTSDHEQRMRRAVSFAKQLDVETLGELEKIDLRYARGIATKIATKVAIKKTAPKRLAETLKHSDLKEVAVAKPKLSPVSENRIDRGGDWNNG